MGLPPSSASPRLARFAFESGARLTVTEYTRLVTPSCAITLIETTMAPPDTVACDADIEPEATGVPATMMVAPKWVAVGATAMLAVACGTFTVYEVVPELNEGTSVAPPLTPRPDKLASDDGARLTCTVYTSWFPA